MPNFVVLRHEKAPGASGHFDLMLEHGGVLLTFSFREFPSPGASGERLADHRLAYLDIEGDIGPGKGRVARVESGSFDMMDVEENAVSVFLRGGRLRGNVRLARESGDTWRLTAE